MSTPQERIAAAEKARDDALADTARLQASLAPQPPKPDPAQGTKAPIPSPTDLRHADPEDVKKARRNMRLGRVIHQL